MAEAYAHASRLASSLLPFIETRASQINRCAYSLDIHTKDARGPGEKERRLYALSTWRDAPFYSERERAALAWTDAVTHIDRGSVPEPVYGDARQHFSKRELVDVTVGIIAINRPKLGCTAFWSFVAGIPLLAAGVAGNSMRLLAGGGTLIGLGVLLAVENGTATLRRGRTRDVTWGEIAIGVSYLTAAALFGLILARNLDAGFVAASRLRILVGHLRIAIVGWAIIAIVGVSNRLLPMYLLAHGVDTRWGRRALGCLATGVPMLVVGMIGPWPAAAWLGAILLACSIWGFFRQAYAFYRVRNRKQTDIGRRFARASVGFLAAAAVTGLLLLAVGGAYTQLGTAYVACGCLGGIVLLVTGFPYKIVPLFSWTAPFGGRIPQGVLATGVDLHSTSVVRVQVVLSGLGIIALLGGSAAASSPIVRTGTSAFLASVLLFAYQLMCVRWRTPPVLRSTAAAAP